MAVKQLRYSSLWFEGRRKRGYFGLQVQKFRLIVCIPICFGCSFDDDAATKEPNESLWIFANKSTGENQTPKRESCECGTKRRKASCQTGLPVYSVSGTMPSPLSWQRYALFIDITKQRQKIVNTMFYIQLHSLRKTLNGQGGLMPNECRE